MNKKITIIAFVILTWLLNVQIIHGTNQFRTEVAISYNFDHKTCFPWSWYRSPSSASTKTFKEKYKPDVNNAIRTFSSKYPKKFLKSHLKGVYLFDELSFYNANFGATYYDDKIYVRYNPEDYTDRTSLTVKQLHHELSSVLMKKYSFPRREWINSNNGQYVSKNRGIDVLKALQTEGRDEGHYFFSRGFLTSYGSSDFENDVNIYAEYLFVLPNRLNTIGKSYPSVAKKSNILKGYYCNINNKFFFCK